ncbi:GAF and ANTAR domain-containing protein [Kytococcus sp. Marseille-QA3725]
MTQERTRDLATEQLEAWIRRFRVHESVEELALEICEVAQDAVGQDLHVSLSLLRSGGKIDTVAATDPICFEVDRYQEEVGEGPCASAAREQPVTHLEDTATDPEWPTFSRWAARYEVASMMAVRMETFEGDESDPTTGRAGLGALNFYSDRPHRFDPETEQNARRVEAPASFALSSRQHVIHLGRALESRDLIGQAKGNLMARLEVGEDAAFDVLRERSRHTNVRLVEVASSVVAGARKAGEARSPGAGGVPGHVPRGCLRAPATPVGSPAPRRRRPRP